MEVYKKETIELRKQFSGKQQQTQAKEQQDKDIKSQIQVKYPLCRLFNFLKSKNQEIDKYLNEISLLSKKNTELEEHVQELLEDLEVLKQKTEE